MYSYSIDLEFRMSIDYMISIMNGIYVNAIKEVILLIVKMNISIYKLLLFWRLAINLDKYFANIRRP